MRVDSWERRERGGKEEVGKGKTGMFTYGVPGVYLSAHWGYASVPQKYTAEIHSRLFRTTWNLGFPHNILALVC